MNNYSSCPPPFRQRIANPENEDALDIDMVFIMRLETHHGPDLHH